MSDQHFYETFTRKAHMLLAERHTRMRQAHAPLIALVEAYQGEIMELLALLQEHTPQSADETALEAESRALLAASFRALAARKARYYEIVRAHVQQWRAACARRWAEGEIVMEPEMLQAQQAIVEFLTTVVGADEAEAVVVRQEDRHWLHAPGKDEEPRDGD